MHQTTGVAVFATHLPWTDRRALSQAWYSALHLAERTPRSREARAAAHAEKAAPRRVAQTVRGSALQPAGDAVARRACKPLRTPSRRRDPSAPQRERREPRSALTRCTGHAPASRTRRAVPSAFAVSAANGGVHLLVHADGTRTRVVAVCAPRLRERVERALAHARFALASHGLVAETA